MRPRPPATVGDLFRLLARLAQGAAHRELSREGDGAVLKMAGGDAVDEAAGRVRVAAGKRQSVGAHLERERVINGDVAGAVCLLLTGE